MRKSVFSGEKPLIEISDREIAFQYVENSFMKSKLRLKNIADSLVSFKIKATNPKTFIVKPNKGLLANNEEIEVEFSMQPMTIANKISSKTITTDEKFLFSAISIPSSISMVDLEEYWKTKNLQDSQDIYNIKAKVVIYTEEEGRSIINSSSPLVESKFRASDVGIYLSPKSDKDMITSINQSQSTDLRKRWEENCQKYSDLKEKLHLIKSERDQFFFLLMEQTKTYPKSIKKKNFKLLFVLLFLMVIYYKFFMAATEVYTTIDNLIK